MLNRFALVDEDNVVYTQYTTYSGGSRHDFLNDSEMDGLNISIVFPYGSPKQLCLAIPTENLTLAGKRMKACFVQIDINEIVDLLAFDDEGRTYFAIYAPGGENLSDTELGPFIAKQNIFEAISGVVAEGSLQKINKDFEKDIEGTMTFRANGVAETLSYVPVEGTDWEMAVLIRESVINERIRDISENSLDASRKQIASTLALVVLFGTVLLLELRIMANNRLAAEKANSKALKTMANTDALTGVRNKLAYSEQETALNHRISGGEIEELAVVVCDINGLKFVNDTEGHAAGDKLIKDASALICEYFDHGAVFRIGGDEFVVILQGRGFELMEEDVKAFNHKAEENIKKGGVVVSLGYSVLSPSDTELRNVFDRADQMMYARKQALKEMGAHTRDSV
ncbi:MAG: diguanylate cyclase [Lachnospiraceae bacterium]|nr:diguanylate cyclase [Lachnospiraceae bacterium]